MNPGEGIDDLIAQDQDWRSATPAKLRQTSLEVDPGIICAGSDFKNRPPSP